MPANEQTWRDQKRMHLVFGISGLVMLGVTLWMFAADHDREWKEIQRFGKRELEPWYTQSRQVEAMSEDFRQGQAARQQLVDDFKKAGVDEADKPLIDLFVAEVLYYRAIEADPDTDVSKQLEADHLKLMNAYRPVFALRQQLADARVKVGKEKDEKKIAALEQQYAKAVQSHVSQLKAFTEKVEEHDQGDIDSLNQAYETLNGDVPAGRDDFVARLSGYIAKARFVEENASRALKFNRADLDVVNSNYGIRVGEGASEAELDEMQQSIELVRSDVARLQQRYEDINTHRKNLDQVFNTLVSDQNAAAKSLAAFEMDVQRLQASLKETQGNLGKTLLGLPILDAFDNSRVKIDQIWLPNLTLNNNFRDVARFDRCTTCHLGIEKTSPGSSEPAYPPTTELALALATPEKSPAQLEQDAIDAAKEKAEAADEEVEERPFESAEARNNRYLLETYGLKLADQGLFHANEVMVEFALPLTRSAKARIERGDVIEYIGDVKIDDRRRAITYLLESVEWGDPIQLRVRRGVPQPYTSHPRLDLIGGSTSPHSFATFGCTVCHDGQGSATSFKWSSHTPNSLLEMDDWRTEHGWFNNHHWPYPMLPNRFSESNCLKCHHQVTELSPSEKFEDPPAPKLVDGFNLIKTFGCFGCHEINGYNGPDQRIGPDLRLEPNFTAAAQQLYINPKLPDEAQEQLASTIFTADALSQQADDGAVQDFSKRLQKLSGHVVQAPWDQETRQLLIQLLNDDRDRPKQTEDPAPSYLQSSLHSLTMALAQPDTPGKLRKVGPSLRHVGNKVDLEFLYSWVKEPKQFRPKTRMPQFFGLHEHLSEGSPGREHAERLEPIEIRAISQYLLDSTQPFAYLQKPEQVTEDPNPERGAGLFQTRGCMACHTHSKFPRGVADRGPNLSNVGDKISTPEGERWLYTWLREPNHYDPRTIMPNTFLDPIEDKDGKVSDPAADIAAFLLDSKSGWKPLPMPELDVDALDELALMYLQGAFAKRQSEQYLESGIPETLRSDLKGDEVALIGMTPENRQEKLLYYVGRRTIGKYGCFGCHDVPGFENAKPIGTGLADWGRKDVAQIAFEQIGQFMHLKYGEHGHGTADHGDEGAEPAGHGDLNLADMKDQDQAYFLYELLNHHRDGFLWQKLHQPRSFDFKKTDQKGYNERLRMPQFPFNEQEIEAVMTFVLGLVAEPPADEFVYHADPRSQAIADGRDVMDTFNCGGCHTLEFPQISFDYDPSSSEFNSPRQLLDNAYSFLNPHFTTAETVRSKATDRRGMGHARIEAWNVRNEKGEIQGLEDEDYEGDDIRLSDIFYQLWQNDVINGQPYRVSEQVLVPADGITSERPYVGGEFARYLHPVVLAESRVSNPAAKYSDAWGWVPPPLVREGIKVQPDWLYDFLINPYPIRPAAVLRMPKFSLSPNDTQSLVDYFAAKDNARYPYDFDPRTQPDYLQAEDSQFPNRLGEALKIVTNGTYCIKCHLVGDFEPAGSKLAQAPNLNQVHRRLRPTFLRDWLANPKWLLPYTGMPENFPVDKPVDPKGFKEPGKLITEGSAPEQLEAVVDLLLNFDNYMSNQQSIKPLITIPATPDAEAAAAGGGE